MEKRLWNKDFTCGFVALFFISCIMYMLNTTIAELAVALGATAVVAGLVTGIYTIGGLISRFIGGGLMNKEGWKRITLIFAVLQIVAIALYFTVTDPNWLLAVRFIHGLAFGATASGIITIASSTVPDNKHGVGMGSLMVATTIATGVGPYVGGAVLDAWGSTGCYVTATLMACFIFVFLALTKVEKDPIKMSEEQRAEINKKPEASGKGIWQFLEKKAIPISICNLMFALSYAGVASFIRLYAKEIDLLWFIGTFFIIQAVTQLICQPLFGKVQDKTGGDNVVMTLGMVVQVIGVIMLFFYPSVVSLVCAAIGTAMGYNTLKSVTQAIATRGIDKIRQSQAVSTFWVFTDLGMGIGPALLGFATGFGGYSYVFLVSSIITAIAIPVYYFTWGYKKGKATKKTEPVKQQ